VPSALWRTGPMGSATTTLVAPATTTGAGLLVFARTFTDLTARRR